MFFPKSHILHMRGVVPHRDCDNIIHYFESNVELHYKGSTSNNLGETEKKDTEILCNSSKSNLNWIKKYLHIALKEYKKQYPMTEKLSSWSFFPEYKIQRYHPSEGYFLLHFENGGTIKSEPEISQRVLAWMIYLNNVTDGGYTEFPDQRKKFQPRVGDILIWPAYFTHPHRGIVSNTQTKYIATGWFNFDPVDFL